jgi:hypothetical protein
MKTVALLAALALSSSPTPAAPPEPAPPVGPVKTIVLPSRAGPVTFEHRSQGHGALKCKLCHRDDKGGEIEGFRKTQHKAKAHAACHECHKKEGKGPQKCADCHVKA